MAETLVSIILPTYNRSEVLSRAIESVCAQTYQWWELIVIDDGSTDHTKKLIESYNSKDSRIRYYKLGENMGVSFARNFGMSQANAAWIAFLDSDDEWLQDKLKKQVLFLSENPTCRILHSDEQWIRNGVRVNPHKKHYKSGGDLFKRCLDLCCVSPSSVMIHRDLIDAYGVFKEDYPVCEDYDLWLRYSVHVPFFYLDQKLIKKYGGHADQLSRKYFAMDYWRVKSIDSLISQQGSALSPEKLDSAVAVLISKCRILLQGYLKHQNFDNFQEVEQIFLKYGDKSDIILASNFGDQISDTKA